MTNKKLIIADMVVGITAGIGTLAIVEQVVSSVMPPQIKIGSKIFIRVAKIVISCMAADAVVGHVSKTFRAIDHVMSELEVETTEKPNEK